MTLSLSLGQYQCHWHWGLSVVRLRDSRLADATGSEDAEPGRLSLSLWGFIRIFFIAHCQKVKVLWEEGRGVGHHGRLMGNTGQDHMLEAACAKLTGRAREAVLGNRLISGVVGVFLRVRWLQRRVHRGFFLTRTGCAQRRRMVCWPATEGNKGRRGRLRAACPPRGRCDPGEFVS